MTTHPRHTAQAAIDAIHETLWPTDDPHAEWDTDTIEYVAHTIAAWRAANPVVIARFHPQAWINDHATDIDHDEPPRWALTPDAAQHVMDIGGMTAHAADLDWLRDDATAPSWVRTWTGPFTISIEQIAHTPLEAAEALARVTPHTPSHS